MNDPGVKKYPSLYPESKRNGGTKQPVNQKLSSEVGAIENQLGVRVFCLIQKSGNNPNTDAISPWLYSQILRVLETLPRGKPIALLLHSPGGDAHSAFRIARAIARHCGEYYVIIPRYAKSAATLLSLGASKIYFGEHAEFGPIDVQVEDFEHERQISALEMVQSLERLNSEAMQAMDSMMSLLVHRSGKRIDSLLPSVLKYAADVTRPIFEKIDTISFTYHARLLKIGEDYARMLLQSNPCYAESAERIALTLTRGYPDHGFVVDSEAATEIGLVLEPVPDILRELIGPSLPSYTKGTLLGFLEDDDASTQKNKAAASGPISPTVTSIPTPIKQPGRNGSKRGKSNRVGKNGST